MASMMFWLYSYFGAGILLGLVSTVLIVFIQRRSWPIMMVNYEERQGGRLAKIYKVQKKTDKNNKTSYWAKPPVMFYGWKALATKPTIMPPPTYSDVTMLEGGGSLILSFSPTANLFLPIEMIVKEEGAKLVARFEILKTWFKSALVDQMKNKLLNPGIKWDKIMPLAMGGMLIIFMVMMIIVMNQAPTAMNQITSTFGDFVTRLEASTGTMSNAVGQVAVPV